MIGWLHRRRSAASALVESGIASAVLLAASVAMLALLA
jgi:hypothetical protein